MNSEPLEQTLCQKLASDLNAEVKKALDSSGLTPYLQARYDSRDLQLFTAGKRHDGTDRIEGYHSLRFEAAFGVGVEVSFKVKESYGDSPSEPRCFVSQSAIGEHSTSMALACSTLYGKAAQAAALFDDAAEYLFDSFLRAQARAEKAAKVVA